MLLLGVVVRCCYWALVPCDVNFCRIFGCFLLLDVVCCVVIFFRWMLFAVLLFSSEFVVAECRGCCFVCCLMVFVSNERCSTFCCFQWLLFGA